MAAAVSRPWLYRGNMAVTINIDRVEEHLTPALSPSLRDAERELIFRRTRSVPMSI
jgi:hypothetical protein